MNRIDPALKALQLVRNNFAHLSPRVSQLEATWTGLIHLKNIPPNQLYGLEGPHSVLQTSLSESLRRQAYNLGDAVNTALNPVFSQKSSHWWAKLTRTDERAINNARNLISQTKDSLYSLANSNTDISARLTTRNLLDRAKNQIMGAVTPHSSSPLRLEPTSMGLTKQPHLFGPTVDASLTAMGGKSGHHAFRNMDEALSHTADLVTMTGGNRMDSLLGTLKSNEIAPDAVRRIIRASALQDGMGLGYTRDGQALKKWRAAVSNAFPNGESVNQFAKQTSFDMDTLKKGSETPTWHHILYPPDTRARMKEVFSDTIPVTTLNKAKNNGNWDERPITTIAGGLTGLDDTPNKGLPIQAERFVREGLNYIKDLLS